MPYEDPTRWHGADLQDELLRFLGSESELDAYFAAFCSQLDQKKAQIESLRIRENEIQAQIDRIYELYFNNQIGTEGFGDRVNPLEGEIRATRQLLPELESEIELMNVQFERRNAIVNHFRSQLERWSDLSSDEKRKIVEQTVESLEVGPESVTIALGYLPNSYELMASKQRGDAYSASWNPQSSTRDFRALLWFFMLLNQIRAFELFSTIFN